MTHELLHHDKVVAVFAGSIRQCAAVRIYEGKRENEFISEYKGALDKHGFHSRNDSGQNETGDR